MCSGNRARTPFKTFYLSEDKMPYNIKKQLSPKGFTILTNVMRPEECSIILQELNLARNSAFEPFS